MERERRIVVKKKTREKKKNETVLIVAFVILLAIAGALFYFLYLKPPSPHKPSNGTQTSSKSAILKEYKIEDLEEVLSTRYMELPPIETVEEEMGKEDLFSP